MNQTLLKLTPNHRLAAYINEKDNRGTNNAETTALSFQSWLEKYYSELQTQNKDRFPTLISAETVEIIWEKIILDSSIGDGLLRVGDTVRLALDAYHICRLWNIPKFDHYFLSEESSIFLNWKEKYETICLKNKWVDSSSLIDWILSALNENLMPYPIASIELIGFDEENNLDNSEINLKPLWAVLIQAFKSKGVQIRVNSLLKDRGNTVRLEVDSPEEECRYAALFAKKYLALHSNAQIGIIILDLEKKRSLIERIFKEILPSATYNISAPLPLATYPFIESAFLVLSLMIGELSLGKISQFLRSPFLGKFTSECHARALMDVKLRAFGESTFTFPTLLGILKNINLESFNNNLNIIHYFESLHEMKPLFYGKASTDTWFNKIQACLAKVGWPGEMPLEPHELHMKQCFDEILLKYRELGPILGEHTFGDAIKRISTLAFRKPFLPKSDKGNVQILGILEGLGHPFDVLWIMGLKQDNWPQKPAPNPFIPYVIQKELNCPKCSEIKEIKTAKSITNSFCRSGREVVFSSSKYIEEEPMKTSPLLSHIKEISPEALGLSKPRSYLSTIAMQSLSSDFQDSQNHADKNTTHPLLVAPPLKESEKTQGGGRLIKLQSICPFKAFAEIRLKADPLPITKLGLSSNERGDIIHQILFDFWKKFKNQNELKQLSDMDLETSLKTIIDSVLNAWAKKRPNTLKKAHLKLEKQRNFNLIYQFMQLEKTRPYFEIVAVEKLTVYTKNDLNLKIRIDRIDKVKKFDTVINSDIVTSNDTYHSVVIDYKTGESSVSNWFGSRPREPQLPLYAISENNMPSAIAFATIKPKGIAFHGITQENGLLPNLKTIDKIRFAERQSSLEAQWEAWKETIHGLMKDFYDGIATVAPLDDQTCRGCHLKSLCRIKHIL